MIRLENSQITQILPYELGKKPEVQAISYSIMKCNQRMMEYMRKSMVYAAIENLPEKIVDVLAVELQTQYYAAELPVEKKRELVKNTLYFYAKAGTPAAVQQMVEQVFGTGELHEWFETGGSPGTFSLSIPETRTEEAFKEFGKMVKKVKNVRSHLDNINFGATMQSTVKAAISKPVITIMMTVK